MIFFALLVSISPNFCDSQFVLSPQSKAELKSAINTCLKLPRGTDCSDGQYGTIGDWDISSVTDTGAIFMGATLFSADILKWNVSSVQDMSHMFAYAAKFNSDLSKWIVSSVTTMSSMLKGATSFSGGISQWDLSSVTDMPSMLCQV